ncbi:MAG: hypothetical protein NTX64_03505 [Elusimicrobia bacterium]|nr:hypothetical protein [Elusimicrobiota bacterium]
MITAALALFLSQPGGPLDRVGGPGRLDPAIVISEAARGPDGLERVAYLYGNEPYLAQRVASWPGEGWRHERIPAEARPGSRVGLAMEDWNRARVSFEAADGSGRLEAVRERFGQWRICPHPGPLPPSVGEGERPLSLSRRSGEGRVRASVVAAFLALILGRFGLLARRARARRALRREAALIGRGACHDLVVRRARACRLSAARAAVLLLHPRAAVVFVDGMRPGELWLKGWTLSAGRPGWIEARCGGTSVEFAPEPGWLPWPGAPMKEGFVRDLRACSLFPKP